MLLVNLSLHLWVDHRLKRNQAIFVNLLGASRNFDRGIWINVPAIAGSSAAKYLSPPGIEPVEHAAIDVNVQVLQPRYSLAHWYQPRLQKAWGRAVASQLKKIIDGQPFCLWMNCPGTLSNSLSRELAPHAALRVFDSSDDFKAFPELVGYVDELASLADHVLCVNETAASRIEHPHKHVFSNCTSWNSFQQRQDGFKLPPILPKPSGATYVGFIGGIHQSRADQPLLHRMFNEFPSCTFVFVGYPDKPEFIANLTSFPNVRFIPSVPYTDLPEVIRSFDVAIVPHLDNECTRGNDLLKVLDYFACRVPVVSTRCSNVERYGEAVYLADNHEQFLGYVRRLVAGEIVHNPAAGEAIAKEQSWDRQVPRLAKQIIGWLAQPAEHIAVTTL
ncbi:MAG: glycosyltransferase [Bryobacteraceae bacterium]